MVPHQLLRRPHHLCPWEPLPLRMEAPNPAEQPGEEPPTARKVAAASAEAGLVQMQVCRDPLSHYLQAERPIRID